MKEKNFLSASVEKRGLEKQTDIPDIDSFLEIFLAQYNQWYTKVKNFLFQIKTKKIFISWCEKNFLYHDKNEKKKKKKLLTHECDSFNEKNFVTIHGDDCVCICALIFFF